MKHRKNNFLSRIKIAKNSDEGTANLVSMIFMVPIFIGLLFTMIDTSIFFFNRAQIQNAARDSARTVAIMGGNGRTPIAEHHGMRHGQACSLDNIFGPAHARPSNAGLGAVGLNNASLSPIECNLASTLIRNSSLMMVNLSSNLTRQHRSAHANDGGPDRTHMMQWHGSVEIAGQPGAQTGIGHIGAAGFNPGGGAFNSVQCGAGEGMITQAAGGISREILNRNLNNTTVLGEAVFCQVLWQYRGIPGSLLSVINITGAQVTIGWAQSEVALIAGSPGW